MRLHPRIRRLVRITGIVLGVVVGIILLLLATLMVRPARERALDEVLAMADGSLPGTLTVEDAAWPALSRVELTGVLWLDGETPFASIRRLVVDLDLRALARKDVHVRALIADGVHADVPRLTAAFPSEPGGEESEPISFPRTGALPWTPSIAVDSLGIGITRILVAEEMSFEAALQAKLDLRANTAPELAIQALHASWIERGWTADSDGLDAAIATGEFGGTAIVDLGPEVELRLELSSDDSRSFRIALSETGSGELAGLTIEGSFTQQPNGAIADLEYRARLVSPGTTRIEELIARPDLLEQFESFGRIEVDASGDLDLTGPIRSNHTLDARASGRELGIHARASQVASEIELSEARIEAPGLEISAAGRYAEQGSAATVVVDLSGLAFLEGLVDIAAFPTDARAHVEAKASGNGNTWEIDLAGSGSAHAAEVDSVEFAVTGRIDGADSQADLRLRSLLRDQIAIAIDARAHDLDAPRIHLAPIRVEESLAQLGTASTPDQPTVRLDLDARSIAVNDLQMTGILGDLGLEASVTEDTGGQGRLSIEWPVVPTVLFPEPDSLLVAHWGSPRLDLGFELEPGVRAGELAATLELPAPWKLAPGLAPEAYDAAPLLAALQARWDQDLAWQADLDLAETVWLDSAFVHLRGLDGTTHLDSMLIRGGPARVTAAGELDSVSVAGKAQLDLVPHPALCLALPDLPQDLQFLVNVRAGVEGSPSAPDARAKLLASVRQPGLEVPLFSAEAEIVEGILQQALLELPERASIGTFSIDGARVELRPEDPANSLIPLWASIGVRGDAEWAQLARIDSVGGAWLVQTDSLRVGARGHSMTSHQPFTAMIAPADSIIRLDGLDLTGDAGSITGSIDLGPDHAQADLEVHLDASIPSVLVQMPAQVLPTGYHLVLNGTEEDLQASIWLEGVKLGSRKNILARLDSQRAGDQIEVKIEAKDELGVVATGDVVLPVTADLLTRDFSWHDGPLSGTVVLDSLPLPYRIGESQGMGAFLSGGYRASAPLLDARLIVGGTGREPVAGAQVGVTFPEIEELRDDRLSLDAIWVGPQAEVNGLGLFDDPDQVAQLQRALPNGGVAVLGALEHAGQPLATIRAGFPLLEGASSPFPGFGPEDLVTFAVSAEPLRLGEWSQVLPRGTDVSGSLWVSAQGEGPIGDFPVEASIRLDEVGFRQSFGSNAMVHGQIDVTGRSSAPVIQGKIEVSSALVRLPESSRDLHPVQGESRLWELGLKPEDRFAALDSIAIDWGWAFSSADTIDESEPALTLAEATELDVTVEIPNSFWIRGQGLEVQLAGELQVALQNGVPRVVGELRAISGQLEVVGARLRLDRGLVHFYGGDTTNPGLDLELSRNQGDVKVMVRVTGTALEPRLAFDSDPPMSQSDIMSYLIFGSSAADLDGAQTQLLQDQAAAALSQFAAPMLENELTQSLGITMMQLQAGENPDDGLSLVVGKYVTPQILVKYEQSLKDRQKYTVNAEYWLNRNFRIETRLSETNSTGIQLNWSRDY